jgi:hypothetical protein
MKQLKRMRTVIFISVLMISTFSSCDNELSKPKQVTVEIQNSQNAIMPYNFDWEDPNLNWMPYPPGQPLITVPWVGQGSLYGIISDDVLADRKKSDGWKLVYNTFSPTELSKNPFFMLYNEYRGLLRVYQYVNDLGTFAQSTYMQDGIFNSNLNVKLLNFADKEIVNASSNIQRVDRVQPKPFNDSPLANNKWYFLQYEMAYDSNITPTTSPNPPQLSFYVNSINISQISLGGSIEGTIKGTIGGTSSNGSNFWDLATPGLKSLGTAGLSAIGVQAISNNTIDATTGANKLGVNNEIWKGVKKGLDGALSGAVNNIPGQIINVLSAIILGNGSTGQTANLTLNANLQVDGTQVGKGSLPSQPVSFYIPGSIAQNSSGGYNFQGYAPLYNKSLGIFNLTTKPTIQISKTRSNLYGGLLAYTTSYTIKSGTLNFQWNPVVNGQTATIENVKTEIISVIGNSFKSVWGSSLSSSGREESVQGEYSLTSPNTLSTSLVTRSSLHPSHTHLRVYLRVSFVVRPTNGAPESAIVKTFEVTQEVSSNY